MEVLTLGTHNIYVIDLRSMITNNIIINNRQSNLFELSITDIPTDLVSEFTGSTEEIKLPMTSTPFNIQFTNSSVDVPALNFYIVSGYNRIGGYWYLYFIDDQNLGYVERGNLRVQFNDSNTINEGFERPRFEGAGASLSLPGYATHAYLVRVGLNRVDALGNVIRGDGFGIAFTYNPIQRKTYKVICNGYEGSFEWSSDEYLLLGTVAWMNEVGRFSNIDDGKNLINPIVYSPEHGIDYVNLTSNLAFPYNMVRKIIMGAGGIESGTIPAYLALESALNNSLIEREVGGPMIGAVDSGMVAMYATPATKGGNKMQDLAKEMWTSELVSSLKQSLFNTSDAIISMSLLPIDLSTATTTTGTPAISGEEPVVLNGVTVGGITMNKVQNQFLRFSWNPVKITGKYRSYLDHSPYTTASIYLPYSGNYDINIDEFVEHYMKLVVIIDMFTGDLRYEIYTMLNEADPQDKWILQYNFTGNITYNIPLTSGGWGDMWTRFIQASAKII